MLTIESLQALGADTAEGLARCMNMEAFYLRLVKMIPDDPNFDRLAAALAANDLDGAFEAAHALKGVLANLSLTQILTPVSEMTELLRARTETDYGALLAQALAQRDALRALVQDE